MLYTSLTFHTEVIINIHIDIEIWKVRMHLYLWIILKENARQHQNLSWMM